MWLLIARCVPEVYEHMGQNPCSMWPSPQPSWNIFFFFSSNPGGGRQTHQSVEPEVMLAAKL